LYLFSILRVNQEGVCSIYDPVQQYKSIFTITNYDKAHIWLLEDERVDGRLLAEEII
jgi:hypothetical protein